MSIEDIKEAAFDAGYELGREEADLSAYRKGYAEGHEEGKAIGKLESEKGFKELLEEKTDENKRLKELIDEDIVNFRAREWREYCSIYKTKLKNGLTIQASFDFPYGKLFDSGKLSPIELNVPVSQLTTSFDHISITNESGLVIFKWHDRDKVWETAYEAGMKYGIAVGKNMVVYQGKKKSSPLSDFFGGLTIFQFIGLGLLAVFFGSIIRNIYKF
jgi:hypothetical protein